jgi:hypothetical protein
MFWLKGVVWEGTKNLSKVQKNKKKENSHSYTVLAFQKAEGAPAGEGPSRPEWQRSGTEPPVRKKDLNGSEVQRSRQ